MKFNLLFRKLSYYLCLNQQQLFLFQVQLQMLWLLLNNSVLISTKKKQADSVILRTPKHP